MEHVIKSSLWLFFASAFGEMQKLVKKKRVDGAMIGFFKETKSELNNSSIFARHAAIQFKFYFFFNNCRLLFMP